MIQPRPFRSVVRPALARLLALGQLDAPAITALEGAIDFAKRVPARRELLVEGQEIGDARLLVSGWAVRARLLPDGRPQLLGFILPGDLIGFCRQARPLATSTVLTVTDVTTCALPPAALSPSLAQVYAISHALEEAYLLAHITRLGRLNAQERIGDLLLELNDRLGASGLAEGGRFELPLTQEALADALGLTSVHVNRMIQQARREGDLQWRAGQIVLNDPAMLAVKVGRMPVQVCATT